MRRNILLFFILASPITIIIVFYLFFNDQSFSIRIIAFYRGATFLGEEGVIFQNDVNDCGAACLEMILKHYNLPVKHGEISQEVNDKKGMNLLQMRRILEDNGLRAEGWRLSFDDLYSSDLPAIALVDKSHYLIIAAITDDGRLIVLDPALGKLKYSRKTFCKIWKGAVLLVRQNNQGGKR